MPKEIKHKDCDCSFKNENASSLKNFQNKKAKRIKFSFQFFTGLCCCVLLIIFIEGLYFACVLNIENSAAQSDVIVIFKGTEKRIKAAYELANQGVAPLIIFSPATEILRQKCDKKYELKDTITHIPEGQAVTTFQNAFYTSRIITAHQFKNVTLVTSDYHMSRSLALMRLFLIGKGVRVQIFKVSAQNTSAGPMAVNTALLKLVYNEMMEFWGSLFEYAAWQMTGVLSKESRKDSDLSKILRSLLLLDVKYAW